MKYYYVYIIRCSDGTYYTGITNSLRKRFQEHAEGLDVNSYTFFRRPLELVYYERFDYVDQAILREKQLKGWRREKKEALINGEEWKLKELSKSKEASAGSA